MTANMIEGGRMQNTLRVRQEKVEERMQELTIQVSVMAEQLSALRQQVSNLCGEVGQLTRQPYNRWEKIVGAVISALAATAIGWLMAHLTAG